MNKPVSEPVLLQEELPTADVCWALLERVLASSQLKRATRLREFLLYVGQRSLRDGLDQIHEQEVGARVFGRPPDYDTSVDNIVRVNASELRKRIDDYFETDGADESLVMEIPRGSYRPVFRSRAAGPAVRHTGPELLRNSAASTQEIRPSVRNRPDRIYLLIGGILIVVLAAICIALWAENRGLRRSLAGYPWQNTPAVASFWSPLLNGHPGTDILLADTSFALIEDITRRSIPLSDYLSRNYLNGVQSPNLSQDRRDDLGLIMQRNNGSLGDFRAAQRILALDPLGKNLRLYSARDYSPALVKQDNVILIGARKSNPWVDLFESSMNFTAEYDSDHAIDYIRNKTPQPGERETYAALPPPSSDGYCVVAFLPNPEQSGKAIIIAGTDSAATEGGGDFITSDEQLSALKQKFNVTTLPYFEVLLKTSSLNGTPIDAKVIAYRIYPGQH
jgi:hypothetical protein